MFKLLISILPLLLKYLFVTIIIEELVLLLFRTKKANIYLGCLGMNILTNLSLNIYLQFAANYYQSLTILEIVVFVVEGLLYLCLTKNVQKAFVLSAICNIASYLIGMII